MVSDAYKRYSAKALLVGLLALPILYALGDQITSNNNVETWLPGNSPVRARYDEFTRTFGSDESIVIAFQAPFPEQELLDALSARIDGLPTVSMCWNQADLIRKMTDNQVDQETAENRLVHLLSSEEGSLKTLLISINELGLIDRQATVQQIEEQLAYCDLTNASITGSPVIATRLDELGSQKNASILFSLNLLICFLLLNFSVGCWRVSGSLMLCNLLCISATQATMYLLGFQMNFIMSSLPVMVMVFTTAASIHFIGHYQSEYPHPNAIGKSLKDVIRPSAFATITTVVGLISLAASDVGPIPMFGIAAAIGTVYSFVIGIFLTPAVLVHLDYKPKKQGTSTRGLQSIAMHVVNRPWKVLVPGLTVTAVCAIGIFSLRSLISPLDFLPNNDQVLQDALLIQNELSSPTSIECTVDFGSDSSSFIERLQKVREIQNQLVQVDNVSHAFSLADFFPDVLTEDNFSLKNLASGNGDVGGLMADGSRLWRVSLRLYRDEPTLVTNTMEELSGYSDTLPVTFTGLAPLLTVAQNQIFDGFWKSFASAFVIITAIMILALRSVFCGLVAMIPNLTPILLIFGILGWCDYPIDIGIMMTASIALGLAVDGTFHFLFSYRDCRKETGCRYRAVRRALLHTGKPIICSAVICGCGLLALALSPFKPTMRFGVLMFCLLNAALIGDLLLLPAFLAIGSRRLKKTTRMRKPEVKQKRIAA